MNKKICLQSLMVVIVGGWLIGHYMKVITCDKDPRRYVMMSDSLAYNITLKNPIQIKQLLNLPIKRTLEPDTHLDIFNFLQHKVNLTPEEAHILFQYAIFYGYEDVAIKLSKENVNVDIVLGEENIIFSTVIPQKKRLISIAAYFQHWEMVELLLTCNSPYAYYPGEQSSTLAAVILHDNRHIFERLIESEEAFSSDPTILLGALESPNAIFYCDFLLKKGVPVNVFLPFCEFTPLSHAVIKNNADLVQLLLRYGADTKQKDIFGKTPLDYARIDKNYKLETLLQNVFIENDIISDKRCNP